MTSSLARLLTCAALLLALCAQAAAQDEPTLCKVTGRVVDEKGRPVKGALVGLRVADPWSLDVFHNVLTDEAGRFVALDSAHGPADRGAFWVSAPPADAHLPVDFMFGRFAYLDVSFAGQSVNFGGKQEIDLGDVRVQAQYHKLSIRLLDSQGGPFGPDADVWRNLRLRVRDAYGDVVGESGVAESAMRKAESSIVVALPKGTWELAVTVFGDSFSWSPLDAPVSLPRGASEEPVPLSVKLSDHDCKTYAASPGETATREEARRELKKRGVRFSKEEFVERARRGNARAVRLFLAAGIYVDTRDRHGQTPLIASSGPWSGQTDVICALLAAGANVNARDFEGRTALFNAAGIVNAHVMQMLLDAGADVNAQTNNGWTPLMLAAQSGQANTVRLLLDAGADVNLRNAEGKTALAVAFRGEGNQVVTLLEKANRAKQ
ncbi:MAG TPA: ankyrin repeat domain-containing protein [Pyrinomonadaceae bacterium]|nr:ankyrin repeat domain-containing protein [Pyrinomonadaceae bacterium]